MGNPEHWKQISKDGEDGKDGQDGQDGVDGKDGAPGKDGVDGQDGRVYEIQASHETVSSYPDGTYLPASLEFSSYYRDGTSATRTAYSGRLQLQASVDGATWTTVVTADSNSYIITRALSTIMTVVPGTRFVRCNLYAAGGTTSLLMSYAVPVINDPGNYFTKNSSGFYVHETDGDHTKGANLRLASTLLQIREDETAVAEFSKDLVALGKGSDSAAIDLIDGKGIIKGFDNAGDPALYVYSPDGNINLFSGEIGQEGQEYGYCSFENNAKKGTDSHASITASYERSAGSGSLASINLRAYKTAVGGNMSAIDVVTDSLKWNSQNVLTEASLPYAAARKYNSGSTGTIGTSVTNIPLAGTGFSYDSGGLIELGTNAIIVTRAAIVRVSGAIAISATQAGVMTMYIGTASTSGGVATSYNTFTSGNRGGSITSTLVRVTGRTLFYLMAQSNVGGTTMRTGANVTYMCVEVVRPL